MSADNNTQANLNTSNQSQSGNSESSNEDSKNGPKVTELDLDPDTDQERRSFLVTMSKMTDDPPPPYTEYNNTNQKGVWSENKRDDPSHNVGINDKDQNHDESSSCKLIEDDKKRLKHELFFLQLLILCLLTLALLLLVVLACLYYPKSPRDCLEVLQKNISGIDLVSGQRSKSSLQVISPLNSVKKEVICDFETDGGGWTIIQQRIAGAPRNFFNRSWVEYEQGFGDNGSYWLGLKAIHALTDDPLHTLRVEVTDWSGETRWAEYQYFQVSPAKDFYRLWVSGYTGNAGDALSFHNSQMFSTPDRDNDEWAEGNCASSRSSGWWFEHCGETNLNGRAWGELLVLRDGADRDDGITWNTWRGRYYSFASAQMKIRPVFFGAKMKQLGKEERAQTD